MSDTDPHGPPGGVAYADDDHGGGDHRPPPGAPEDSGGTIREVLITVLTAVGLALLLQQFLVKPFRIPSGSMENTLRCGDRVLVDRLSYRFGDPKRYDVVVFHPPAGIGEGGQPDPSTVAGEGTMPRRAADGTREAHPSDLNYIKRIIGMPGDHVEVRDHHAFVDSKPLREPFLHPLKTVAGVDSGGDMPEITVPKGLYLMLGDHRDNSADGRVFGLVPRSFIIGKAFMVYWPPQRFGGLPAHDSGAASTIDPNCLESGTVPAIGGADG